MSPLRNVSIFQDVAESRSDSEIDDVLQITIKFTIEANNRTRVNTSNKQLVSKKLGTNPSIILQTYDTIAFTSSLKRIKLQRDKLFAIF